MLQNNILIKTEEIDSMMLEIIKEIKSDVETGILRYLQANPYSSFPFYNFNKIISEKGFKKAFLSESETAKLYKKKFLDMLHTPNGKNTFFIVGYQGCGKTTFIQSVVSEYKNNTEANVLLIDCDKNPKKVKEQVKSIFCSELITSIDNIDDYCGFINFFNNNLPVIKTFNNNIKLLEFFEIINNLQVNIELDETKKFIELHNFISSLDFVDVLYLLFFWHLSLQYESEKRSKLLFVIDNLDYIDDYNELVTFIEGIDAFTIEFSDKFSQLKVYKNTNKRIGYIDKIKIFISMRETTRANLPSSHFSNAFNSIYISEDMSEWYDKSAIIEKRLKTLKDFDKYNELDTIIYDQIELILSIIKDDYTKRVIFPLFNNNYRSCITMLVRVVINNPIQVKSYKYLMSLNEPMFRHGARGILFKLIFDRFSLNDGNEENCLKKIGVLDLLNRANKEVSICRLLLSYLSNYTETKCSSARNSVSIKDILETFQHVFKKDEVVKILWEMFNLRDTEWTHLISFNQIEYYDKIKNNVIEINKLDPETTLLHYSCAGKIYIEYVTTHFEFYSVRIFKNLEAALFSDKSFIFDKETNTYKFFTIINKVYLQVKSCCDELIKFNKKLCNQSKYGNPYKNSELYKDSHYVCQFKRKNIYGEERRFKQFHEDRIINSHIVYIDAFRIYVLNYCKLIDKNQKAKINERLTGYIKKYVDLLEDKNILINEKTSKILLSHYKKQIEKLQNNWDDFTTEISYNE